MERIENSKFGEGNDDYKKVSDKMSVLSMLSYQTQYLSTGKKNSV